MPAKGMFEARLDRAVVLKRLVDATKDLCNEVNLDVSSEGITMQSMDTSHVCLVMFHLLATGFDRFECDEAQTIGINLDHLAKLLKCADPDDSIALSTCERNADVLTIRIAGSQSIAMDLKLMSIESDHLSVPDRESSVRVRMDASRFQRATRDLSMFGDTLKVSAIDDASDGARVRLELSGDIGSIAMDIEAKMDGESVEVSEPVTVGFALRYLNSFAKAATLASHVNIGIDRDMPITVAYNIDSYGWLKFFLAPKLDDIIDDDDS